MRRIRFSWNVSGAKRLMPLLARHCLLRRLRFLFREIGSGDGDAAEITGNMYALLGGPVPANRARLLRKGRGCAGQAIECGC
jgi:hypothetical protein